MTKEAIILCGGQATRFRPVTETVPKALIEIYDKPILEYQLEWLRQQDYDHIILAVGYKWEMIRDWIVNNSHKFPELTFNFSTEDEPLGTGGALKKAMCFLTRDNFLVLNGDNITTLDLKELEANKPPCITLVAMPFRFGIVDISNNGKLVFREKPTFLVNAGIYYFNKSIKKRLPDKGSIEKDLFPEMELNSYIYSGMWKTFDKEEDLKC